MDQKDREILSVLMADGKAQLRKVARKAGVPVSTAHHRIQKMEKTGVIARYSAVPDYQKVGLPVCAYVFVNVDYSNIISQDAVARELGRLEGVLEANIVSGEIDIIVKVRAKDIGELGETVIKRMRTVRGVAKTVTSVVMKEIA